MSVHKGHEHGDGGHAHGRTNGRFFDPKVDQLAHDESFFKQFMGMARAFWVSRQCGKLLLIGFGIVAVVGATAYGQIRLNAWNQPFYDALAGKDMPEFLHQILVFGMIAGTLLVLNVAQLWLRETAKITLREGLVYDLTREWLISMRAFRMTTAGEIGANPDQRIHEDARHLTELTAELGIGLLQSTLLLASFIGVLWALSRTVTVPLGEFSFVMHGYMVWSALLYAGTASFLSWLVGRPLIDLNAKRYAREAELRFALVRVSEEISGIALYGGEGDERQRLNEIFGSVIEASKRVVTCLTRLTWVTAGYGWFTIVAPIFVAAPIYFRGQMTLGELMTIVGAFNQVQQALRWFVDNFSVIADWRATLLRVATFRTVVRAMDSVGEELGSIVVEEGDGSRLQMDELHIAGRETCVMLSDTHCTIEAGERVLISSEVGSEKIMLFQALAGLWPWGQGRIHRPPRESMMFMPERAYVPPGTLRAAITYPHSTMLYDDAQVSKALTAVGLERFTSQLHRSDRWDKLLNEDEKQCLAFARVLLQQPKWVIMDDAFEPLDPVSRRRIEAIFMRDLPDVTVISIGHAKLPGSFFSRSLHIVADSLGPVFRPASRHRGAHWTHARAAMPG